MVFYKKVSNMTIKRNMHKTAARPTIVHRADTRTMTETLHLLCNTELGMLQMGQGVIIGEQIIAFLRTHNT